MNDDNCNSFSGSFLEISFNAGLRFVFKYYKRFCNILVCEILAFCNTFCVYCDRCTKVYADTDY